MSDQTKPLEKVASIVVLDETYDLAKNGSHFHLVEHREPDAYCRPVARKVGLDTWAGLDRMQALLDLIGSSYSRIAVLEEELDRAHAALQREAEPESPKSRRPVVLRESSGGVVIGGLLEPKPEEGS